MKFFRQILDGITLRLGGETSMARISRSSDVALAVLIIAILAMIVIPLNPHIIDYLIALELIV